MYIFGFCGLSAVYGFLFFSKTFETSGKLSFVLGLLLRIFLVFSTPIFEDDWARYLWDGWISSEKGSPYGITPESFFGELDPTRTEILSRINHPDWPTIYGPALEIYFYLIHLLFPWKLWALKLFLLVPDILLFFLIRTKYGVRSSALYFWNPILIKEVFLNAHPDIIGIFLLFYSFYLAEKYRFRLSFFIWGLSLAVKGFGVLLFPFLLKLYWSKTPNWKKAGIVAAISILGIVLAYSPFLFFSQETDFTALSRFIGSFTFFPLGYNILHTIFGEFARAFWTFPAIVSILFFLNKKYSSHLAEEEKIGITFFLFFYFSPVVNAWYLLWMFPFLLRIPGTFWPSWVLLFLGQVSYLNYANTGDWKSVLEKGYYAHPDLLLISISCVFLPILLAWLRVRFSAKITDSLEKPSHLS
ncbi:putative membrane protein [Leptospira johnsonii]|uniref:Putative membrane protein n=1 Tax=Leptospira johnsonii TaxID=1917820 RepID=A0A2P2D2F2_9LEPT|nr:putative membrane protein [Leptospira johnsonii]